MRIFARSFLFLALVAGGIALFGPREVVDPHGFDAAVIGDDLDGYLETREADFADIRKGQQKQIIWHGETGQKTPVSIVYVHGFSASLHEIRPVPDQIAQTLGANLYFTRLRGHGRTGAAMAEAHAGDWMHDMAEAMEIGRRLGERVVVVTVSTGGTLATLAAADPVMSQDMAGLVLISPNFGMNAAGSFLLTWPFARQFVPLIAGQTRSWKAHNDAQEAAWTTSYPIDPVFPLAALVKEANSAPVAKIDIPAFFIYSPEDQVIQASKAADVAARWGGPAEIWLPEPDPDGDPSKHVLTGDILSPGSTAQFTQRITQWVRGL